MYELDVGTIIVSIILTWGIGLLPPVLIRYVFLKRPIGNWPAIGICAFFWIFNFILFTVLGSKSKTHAVLLIVAGVSYGILRRASKAVGVLTPQVPPDPSPNVPTLPGPDAGGLASPVDTRLSELKSLYDRGLISESVYYERQKEILHGQ